MAHQPHVMLVRPALDSLPSSLAPKRCCCHRRRREQAKRLPMGANIQCTAGDLALGESPCIHRAAVDGPEADIEQAAIAAINLWDSFQGLPIGLQEYIVDGLGGDGKQALRQACSETRGLVDCSVKSIALRRLACTNQDAVVQARAFSHFPNAHTLLLQSEGMTGEGMACFVHCNRDLILRLRKVQADPCAVLHEYAWDIVLQACDPRVLTVWMPCSANRRQRGYMDKVLMLAQHPGGCGLLELDLSHSRATDQDMDIITRHCKRLEVLNLTCTRFTDTGLAACGQLQSLKRLNIDKCNFTGDGFTSLSTLTTLTQLQIGWCLCFTSTGCRAVAQLPCIQELSVTKHPHSFPELDALACEGAAIRQTLSKVTVEASTLTDKTIEALASLPALRQLHVSDCTLKTRHFSQPGGVSREQALRPLQEGRRLVHIQEHGSMVLCMEQA